MSNHDYSDDVPEWENLDRYVLLKSPNAEDKFSIYDIVDKLITIIEDDKEYHYTIARMRENGARILDKLPE